MSQKKEKQLPPRSKTVTISGIEYNIKFPTTGQFIDIANLKAMYSSGQQGRYNLSTVSGLHSYYLVEAISFFEIILQNQLRLDLNVKSIFDLDMIQSKEIVNVYVKEITPWIDDWLEILNEIKDPEKDDK